MTGSAHSDTANWMTAVGTILASVAAVGLAVWANWRENERRRTEEAENRRNDSILGVAIIEALLEEVCTGQAIMVRVLNGIHADSEIATQLLHGIYQAMAQAGGGYTALGRPSAKTPPEASYTATSSAPSSSGTAFAQTLQQKEPAGAIEGNMLPLLPGASWEGTGTIPDKILLRLIATDSGCAADELTARDIRVHCKNYFTHIRENVNTYVPKIQSGSWTLWEEEELRKLLENGPGKGNYIGDTEKVIVMLATARDRLEKNAKAEFPK
jgi:hypothetical protein